MGTNRRIRTLFNINSLNPEYRSVTGDNPTVTLKMTVTSKQDDV